MTWALLTALGAGLLAFLVRGHFLFRKVRLFYVAKEMELTPWWMACGWPRTKASEVEMVIIPFHWVTLGWWKLMFWFMNKPIEILWPLFYEDFHRIKKLEEENRRLKMRLRFNSYFVKVHPGVIEMLWSEKIWTEG